MRAAIFKEFGGPEVVHVAEVARPEARAGEVVVRVAAAGMNHLDLWVRRGLPIETTMPHIGGSDVAGEVVEVGAGVAPELVGARVVLNPSLTCGHCEWCQRGEDPLCETYRILGEHTQGGLAELVAVPAANIYRIPDDYSFERAAAAPLAFLTAWRALTTRARLQAGERVLVTGASGGVSTAAIQIARHLGARVYALTTTENVERVRALGADVVYDRDREDYSREIWAETGKRGVDVVLDSVGAALWKQNLRVLARRGRLVTYGATTGPSGEVDIRTLFWKQLDILGSTMSNRTEFEMVMALVFSGRLEPVIDVVWPLERAREAHERLESGRQFGKVVLRP